jgi:hypothetical protein
MIIIDQKISDTMSYTLSTLIGTGCGSAGLKTIWARRTPRPAAVLRARTQWAITRSRLPIDCPQLPHVNRSYSPCRRAAHPLAFGRCHDG